MLQKLYVAGVFLAIVVLMAVPTVAIVAIARNEENYIEEWIAYHRLIGFDHLFIYDHSRLGTLTKQLKPFKEFVTVRRIRRTLFNSLSLQLRAYKHALENGLRSYDWVQILDVDEFVNLRKHQSIQQFVAGFKGIDCIKLHWRIFGHNGHYNQPTGLVLEHFTRCDPMPDPFGKVLSRTRYVELLDIHKTRFNRDVRFTSVEGQELPKRPGHDAATSILETAYINHYQSKSFKHLRSKIKRGVASGPYLRKNHFRRSDNWRSKKSETLQKFVEYFSFTANRATDTSLKEFAPKIKQFLKQYY